jgi:hypothetical protein
MRNTLLLAGVWVLAALAIWTMLPLSAPKSNDLGYISACPFAPWSTLMLLLGAGILWVVRQYFLTRPPPPPSIS